MGEEVSELEGLMHASKEQLSAEDESIGEKEISCTDVKDVS